MNGEDALARLPGSVALGNDADSRLRIFCGKPPLKLVESIVEELMEDLVGRRRLFAALAGVQRIPEQVEAARQYGTDHFRRLVVEDAFRYRCVGQWA